MSATRTIVLRLTIEDGSGETDQDADWLVSAVAEYLTRPDCDLAEVYGPQAFGGYEGAYISAITAGQGAQGADRVLRETWGKRA